MYGGTGDDMLVDGFGNDEYDFGVGDGQDIVSDTDATVGNKDRIVFTSFLRTDQLWFSRANNDLKIAIIGRTDSITVKNWYLGAQNQVETFSANGRTLLSSSVNALVQAMATFDRPPVAGETELPQRYQATLAPVIAASWTTLAPVPGK